VTCLHAGWLASLSEALRNDLIAALNPAEARALLYGWPYWARANQLPPAEIGGCGSFLPDADLARRGRAQN
jgi:hypothetical protein